MHVNTTLRAQIHSVCHFWKHKHQQPADDLLKPDFAYRTIDFADILHLKNTKGQSCTAFLLHQYFQVSNTQMTQCFAETDPKPAPSRRKSAY